MAARIRRNSDALAALIEEGAPIATAPDVLDRVEAAAAALCDADRIDEAIRRLRDLAARGWRRGGTAGAGAA